MKLLSFNALAYSIKKLCESNTLDHLSETDGLEITRANEETPNGLNQGKTAYQIEGERNLEKAK